MIRRNQPLRVMLTEPFREKIARIAKENGISMSEMVRQGLISELRRLERESDAKTD